MKKLITHAALLFVIAGAANAQESSNTKAIESEQSSNVYIGFDLFDGESNVKSTVSSGGMSASASEDLDSDGFRLKLGARLKNDLRVQAYFKNESIELFDNDIKGVGADLIKAFSTSSILSPYIQAGLTFDSYEINDSYPIDYTTDEIVALGFKLGVGTFIEVNDKIEIVGGLDWQRRNWDDAYGNIVTAGYQVVTVETSDTSTTLFLGLNIHL
jgi:hypothetical protein